MVQLLALGVWACGVAPAGETRERFYAIEVEGRRIGYCRYLSERTADGTRMTGETVIKVALLGVPGDMAYRSVATFAADNRRPIRYALEFRRGDDTTTVDCRAAGTNLTVSRTSAGSTDTKTVRWAPGMHLVEGNCIDTWNTLFAALGSGVTQRRILMFEPLTGGTEPMRLARGRPTSAMVARTRTPCDTYVLGEGPQRVEFVVSRTSREVIEFRVPAQKAVCRLSDRTALKGLQTYDAASRLFSLVDSDIRDPNALTSLRVRIRAEVVGERVAATSLRNPYQEFSGTVNGGRIDGTLSVRRAAYDGQGAPAFTGKPPADASLVPFLRPEANVESDAPEIAALARDLTKGSATQWDAVKSIGRWVHANIAYAITGSGAKQCLKNRKGDCGPHTWLTIALCRAVGIPARITGGALYSRALGGSFGQHYWTRVWMGSAGWIAIDTTTGEVGTLSPAHLTLWNLGGLASLSVSVADFSPRPTATASAPAAPERRSLTIAPGASERWVFRADGKVIGTQTAECIGAAQRGEHTVSEWRYAVELDLGAGASKTHASIAGTFELTERAVPVSLTVDARSNGAQQRLRCTFGPEAVVSSISLGGQEMQRKTSWTGGELLQMNNVLTLMSLATRTVRISPGGTVGMPLFAAGPLQKLEVTLTALAQTETIQVMGRPVECVVADAAPLGNRFHIARDTGELVRVTVESQKLRIDRE
jgi:transglutaminase-like putative cysteine protease